MATPFVSPLEMSLCAFAACGVCQAALGAVGVSWLLLVSLYWPIRAICRCAGWCTTQRIQTRTVEVTLMKKLILGASALTLGAAANAATDLAPITAAQTDALAVVAALVAMGVAIWGANYIRTKFFR
jgi:hypothetical protein